METQEGTAGTRTSDTPQMRRPLGPSERWLWIIDQISPMNAIVWVHLRGRMEHRQLVLAAEAVVAEHPLLRVHVATDPDGTNPRFVPTAEPRIPIRTVHVAAEDTQAADIEVDTVELHERIDWRTGPLARIVDIVRGAGTPDESHDLILTTAHLITDGMGMTSLLRRLLEHAAQSTGDGASTKTTVRSRNPLPVPEDLLPRRLRSIARAKVVSRVDRAINTLSKPRSLEPEATVPPRQRRTRFIRRILPAADLDVLLARCRREGVTLHGALTAATARGWEPRSTPPESAGYPSSRRSVCGTNWCHASTTRNSVRTRAEWYRTSPPIPRPISGPRRGNSIAIWPDARGSGSICRLSPPCRSWLRRRSNPAGRSSTSSTTRRRGASPSRISDG